MIKDQYRILYKKIKTKPGILRSCRTFISNKTGAEYVIELNENTMTYRIININKQEVIKSSKKDNAKPVKNKTVLKRQAKRALKKLGVIFNPEIKMVSETSIKTLEENRYVPKKIDSNKQIDL